MRRRTRALSKLDAAFGLAKRETQASLKAELCNQALLSAIRRKADKKSGAGEVCNRWQSGRDAYVGAGAGAEKPAPPPTACQAYRSKSRKGSASSTRLIDAKTRIRKLKPSEESSDSSSLTVACSVLQGHVLNLSPEAG